MANETTIQISEELYLNVLQGVIDNFLKPKFIELGMNATGEWLNTIQPRIVEGRGEIWGADYTYFLANGRAPGRRPPVSALLPWVNAKFGIGGQEALSIAFAVATKIGNEGTRFYPEGTDLLEILNSNEVKQYIYTNLGQALTAEITLILRKQIDDNFS